MAADRRLLRNCIGKFGDVTIGSPNPTLVRSYLTQSKNAIVAMDTLAPAKVEEWIVETSYYAKYFVVSALLASVGVRSKNHACTAEFFEFLFRGSHPTLTADLKAARGKRVGAIYNAAMAGVDFKVLVPNTKVFVTDVEGIINGLRSTDIARLRSQLSGI
ncbi:MAG TPA: hypothetical protein VEB87_01660 [Nitrososphaerales archaeon]|nr:hypothetical protein [Nitrososphaerales archaeon]